MTRKPGYLAALAGSAVPGLDPVAVRAARGLPGNRCDVAFVTDTQRRAWVVRVPTTSAVGAQLDASVPLLSLISRRLPFQVPSPRGFVGVPDGRAMVYPFLHGRSVVLEETPPGPGVAAELGRALAALHNVDRAVFEEAGLAVYDSETYRRRHLADLDRAAATGHVPTALLSRWERALEDVSAWRFAPTPVHGDLTGGRVLVSFTDEQDPGTAAVRGITGWEHAQVADPADDFAAVAEECSTEAFDSVLEAYAVARIERPDRHLRLRARLAAELRALRRLLDAVTAAEPLLITRRAAELRALDERTVDLPDLVPPPPPVEPVPRTSVVTSPSPGTEPDSDITRDDDSDVDPLKAEAGAHEQPADEPAGAAAGPDERNTSEDTQRLLFGDAAEATTVIPADELARLRADRVEDNPADTRGAKDGGAADDGGSANDGGSGDERSVAGGAEAPDGVAAETTVIEVAVERTMATDESWYQVIEPIVPGTPHGPSDPDGPVPVGDAQPTDVLVEAASPPDADSPAGANAAPDPDADSRTGAHAAPDPDADSTVDPDAADEPATSSAARPGQRRRHRRATRP